MNILIVDDDEIVAQTIKSIIEINGTHRAVGLASDLESALTIADDQQVDLAFVDIALQESTTGYMVAAELRKRDIACVFVTGLAPPFDIPELALGCLTKPFDADDVHGLLAALASERLFAPSELPANARLYHAAPGNEDLDAAPAQTDGLQLADKGSLDQPQ